MESAAGTWCDGLDPLMLSGSDVVDGLKQVSAVIRRLTAAQTGLADRVPDPPADPARLDFGPDD
jgi:hypothetical protein